LLKKQTGFFMSSDMQTGINGRNGVTEEGKAVNKSN